MICRLYKPRYERATMYTIRLFLKDMAARGVVIEEWLNEPYHISQGIKLTTACVKELNVSAHAPTAYMFEELPGGAKHLAIGRITDTMEPNRTIVRINVSAKTLSALHYGLSAPFDCIIFDATDSLFTFRFAGQALLQDIETLVVDYAATEYKSALPVTLQLSPGKMFVANSNKSIPHIYWGNER